MGLGIEKYNRLGIPESETLISTVLQDAGYFTGAIGKWHMGFDQQYHPNQRGFDEYYGLLGGGHMYFPEKFQPIYDRQKKANKKNINEYIVSFEHNGQQVKETEYITDALSRESVRFIEEASQKDKPFFLYVAYNAPHTPLEAKEEDLKHYLNIKDKKRRTYAAMVHAVDRGVGQIVDALKQTKTFDDTLIVFFSDNGGKLGAGATNIPLAEGKGSIYEGGYRVPMFFHWPENVKAKSSYDHPVSALDLYPTLARLGKAEVPASQQLDGVDIWDALVANKNPRPEGMIFAMRHMAAFSNVGARRGKWKIIHVGSPRVPWKLFDMENDIGETTDVSKQHPEIVRSMVAEVEAWSKDHTDPMWFHALPARDHWRDNDMPNHKIFEAK